MATAQPTQRSEETRSAKILEVLSMSDRTLAPFQVRERGVSLRPEDSGQVVEIVQPVRKRRSKWELYLKLFHGRETLEEQMDGWGTDGPVFGPLSYVHTTYRDTVHIGDDEGDLGDLFLVEECLYYDGIYYGDWSAFITSRADVDDLVSRSGHWSEEYDEAKADPGRHQ
jgi:hypothetical protein